MDEFKLLKIEYKAAVLGKGIKASLTYRIVEDDLKDMDALLETQKTILEMLERCIDDENRLIRVIIHDEVKEERLYKLTHKARKGGLINVEKRDSEGYEKLYTMDGANRNELCYLACEFIERAWSEV